MGLPLWKFLWENFKGQCTIHQDPHTPLPPLGHVARHLCATIRLRHGVDVLQRASSTDLVCYIAPNRCRPHWWFPLFPYKSGSYVYFLRLRHLLIYILWLPSHNMPWHYMYYVLIAHTFYALQTHSLKLFANVCWQQQWFWCVMYPSNKRGVSHELRRSRYPCLCGICFWWCLGLGSSGSSRSSFIRYRISLTKGIDKPSAFD